MDWNLLFEWIWRLGVVQFIVGLWTGHQKRAQTNKKLVSEIPDLDETLAKINKKLDVVGQGMQEILHTELDELCYRIIYVQKGGTEQQFTRLKHIYESYHALQGNGTGTKLYKQAIAMPVILKEQINEC
ncbi:hypothetical protein PT281_02630 [Lactobacillus sp. ESL0701]|uniref:hypothetical protein n=1 Tax=Lactobacillus sp. ESL0701 TaxID=2983217 RepID=UPI0023F8CB18|nr:hypothetical protein [Lactobacillus sp. ESL0701]MDF7672184.1 hypothetical protein [Lactobacillus sp. ESL0701]